MCFKIFLYKCYNKFVIFGQFVKMTTATSLVKAVSKPVVRKLLLGQIYPTEVPKTKKVLVKHLEFDEWLKMYFRKDIAYIAHDAEDKCKTGDVVLIEELSRKMTRDITHQILKVVYPFGDVTDPITGKKCTGENYRDDLDKIERLWGKNEKGGFDYEKAPPRGWQEGRKDWSHKPAFRKYHEFTDRDVTEAEW